jgi:D-glycero-alpha-D-manno-heptose-7-phosphate kinase
MIVSKTPLRVSFIGGGSDFENFFNKSVGCVLGTTINQYVYVSLMPLPVFAEEKFRFTYRVTESVDSVEEFKHPVVKTILSESKNLVPLNISTMANLPGRSGLGSSSSFTVGFLNALSTLENKVVKPEKLAEMAVQIERFKLKEDGGFQDQYHAAFGGLRSYKFEKSGLVDPTRIVKDNEFIRLLSSCLILVPASGPRDSSTFAKKTEKSILEPINFSALERMANLALDTSDYLLNSKISPEDKLGRLTETVNEGWKLKNELSGNHTNKVEIERMIEEFIKLGARSARLCGAGGSGFILLISAVGKRNDLLRELQDFNAFAIELESNGSHIILNEEDEYSPLGVVK